MCVMNICMVPISSILTTLSPGYTSESPYMEIFPTNYPENHISCVPAPTSLINKAQGCENKERKRD